MLKLLSVSADGTEMAETGFKSKKCSRFCEFDNVQRSHKMYLMQLQNGYLYEPERVHLEHMM